MSQCRNSKITTKNRSFAVVYFAHLFCLFLFIFPSEIVVTDAQLSNIFQSEDFNTVCLSC